MSLAAKIIGVVKSVFGLPMASAAGSINLAATNIVTDTTTGTQIGTAATQKLSVYGVTPIVQPVLATGAGHTVDDVITALQNFGIVRQS